MKSNHCLITPRIARPSSPASQRVISGRSAEKRWNRRLERRIWIKTVRDLVQDIEIGGAAPLLPSVSPAA